MKREIIESLSHWIIDIYCERPFNRKTVTFQGKDEYGNRNIFIIETGESSVSLIENSNKEQSLHYREHTLVIVV